MVKICVQNVSPNSFHSGWIVLGLLLLVLPLLLWNPYIFAVPCPIKTLTQFPCPTCGSWRSMMALLRLDLATAFYYNPLFVLTSGFATLPAAAALWQWRRGERIQIILDKRGKIAMRLFFSTLIIINEYILLSRGI